MADMKIKYIQKFAPSALGCFLFLNFVSLPLLADDGQGVDEVSLSGEISTTPEFTPDNSTKPVSRADEETSAKKKDPLAVAPPTGQVPEGLWSLGQPDFHSPFAFVADKSRRTLSIWRHSGNSLEAIAHYPMDYGKKDGDKEVLGDLKTPEGIYFFGTMYEGNNLDFNEYGSRAFTMNYPNLFDRRDRKTGSGIWLHAIPEKKSLMRGSRGCLVVRDEIIKEVTPYINLQKTPVLVFNKVNYVPAKQVKMNRKKWLTWLSRWRDAWQGRELDTYMEFYHPEEFRSRGMNWSAWKRYKNNLNQVYNYINVDIGQPLVMQEGKHITVRFLQDYKSEKNADFGEKVLYIKETNPGEYKIIAEDWQATQRTMLAQLNTKKE